jgi:hypothetical protein
VDNTWPGVSNKTVLLLEQWVERRISNLVKSSYMPYEARRFVFTKGYNKFGRAIFRVTVLEGIDFIRSTKFKEFTSVDEFAYAFLGLDRDDRLIILSYIDPFDEIKGISEWKVYLGEMGIVKNHEGRLLDAMRNLQYLAEQRGIVPSMTGILKGWNEISRFIGCSVPKAVAMARELKLPISYVGGEVWAVKDKLEEAVLQHMENHRFWKRKANT